MEQNKKIQMDMKLKQQLNLSAQLLQSMEILQMTSQELLEYLQNESLENPVLELEEPAALNKEFAELQSRQPWISGGRGSEEACLDPFGGRRDKETESLEAFLRDQLERRKLPAQVLAVAEYLAANLTEDGYLTDEDLEAVRALNVPEALIDQALTELQKLEPAGVGARDLRECLLLQLERQGRRDSAAWKIADRCLQELGRKQYEMIAQTLKLTRADVTAAEQEIRQLNPRPGSAFYEEETPEYVRPDLFVVRDGEELRVLVNEYYLPQLTMSDCYARMFQSTEDEELKSYLQKKIRHAQWVMECLQRRHATLMRCGEEILQVQRTFFETGDHHLQPMTLGTMAEDIGMHPSTISRALRGKYLQCSFGTFPVRWFFSRALGSGGEWSAQRVRQRIAELIRGENKKRPLSDQKITDLLAAEGAQVARRTVAKYRESLGFPNTAGRKQ